MSERRLRNVSIATVGAMSCLLCLGTACGPRAALTDSAVADTASPGFVDTAPSARDVHSGADVRDAAVSPPDVAAIDVAPTANRDLDMLFMIDNSSSMAPLQAKLAARLPDFMEVLKALPGGLPNLHVAVVSSSLGAGKFASVPGCAPNTVGNGDGVFEHSAACTMLNSGSAFISSIEGVNNFTGDISDAFKCIAMLGDRGCGFEHQFESIRLSLRRAQKEDDPNYGFLRPKANLAIVMLTNEDDCSVPDDSNLFDPVQQTVADPLGGLQSYRCNEFGHLCDGQRPPHNVSSLPVTLNNCVSAEDGRLVTVKDFVDFVRTLKPGRPDAVMVAVIAGPPTPYMVAAGTFRLANGSCEMQPQVSHSCMQTSGEYADPAVRISQAVDSLGANATMATICADDFKPALTKIAQAIGRTLVQ